MYCNIYVTKGIKSFWKKIREKERAHKCKPLMFTMVREKDEWVMFSIVSFCRYILKFLKRPTWLRTFLFFKGGFTVYVLTLPLKRK